MSQLTSHVLDTGKGVPAAGITVILYQGQNDQWTELARAITDTDGRITDLLTKGDLLKHTEHKLRFETGAYFDKNQVARFYPYVEIVFDIVSDDHYHVPLLLSPFAYSTYRGS
jgi:5-hydroxyisourate hydrolase